MNVSHSCDSTGIFIRRKMKCYIQLHFAPLNRTFHLSLHENICTIALIICIIYIIIHTCIHAKSIATWARGYTLEYTMYSVVLKYIEYDNKNLIILKTF